MRHNLNFRNSRLSIVFLALIGFRIDVWLFYINSLYNLDTKSLNIVLFKCSFPIELKMSPLNPFPIYENVIPTPPVRSVSLYIDKIRNETIKPETLDRKIFMLSEYCKFLWDNKMDSRFEVNYRALLSLRELKAQLYLQDQNSG